MDEWAAFVTARLDEDEAAAKAAQAPSPWKAAADESDTWIVTDATGEPLIYDEGTPSLEEAAHVARHDPARVLREVEAGRQLLGAYEDACKWHQPYPDDLDDGRREGLKAAVEIRAAVYSDHPDYPG